MTRQHKIGKPYVRMIQGLLLVTMIILIVLVSCRNDNTHEATLAPVTVQLSWLHYASFGGLYAADQNGYYADHGLDVSFLEGGPSLDHLASVLRGDAQFGVLGADELILARAEGKPVRAIAVILRHSPAVFVAPASSGITQPQDFAGKTIRVTSQLQPTLHTITARVGLQPDQYEKVILPSALTLFSEGKADVWSVYYNSFAVELQAAGHELDFIFPNDYGIHFYSDTIFTTDAVIDHNPELVDQFLRATVRGLHDAIEDPEAVGRMVQRYDPRANPVVETRKAIASVPLISSGSDYPGDMSPESWAEMHDTLLAQGVLDAPMDITAVYTRQFLIPVIESFDESTD